MPSLHALLRIPPPDRSDARWHVSPAVDVLAYAFSWLWVLIPLVALGETHPVDYLALYFLITSLNFTHRHFTLPYVYLDRQVFRQFPWRFTVFPAVMFAAFAASPSLWSAQLAARSLAPVDLALGVGLILLGLQTFWVVRRRRPIGPAESAACVIPGLGLATLLPNTGPGGVVATSWPWLLAALVASLALSARFGWNGRRREGPHLYLTGVLLLMVALLFWLDPRGTPTLPARDFAWRHALAGVAFFAGLWNVWHVYSQKYGILRLYNAKNAAAGRDAAAADPVTTSRPESRLSPGWVDRWLVFGWVPLYFAWLGPSYRTTALERFSTARDYLVPLLDTMTAWQPWLIPLSIASVVGSIAVFLWREWTTTRLRNTPRLWMAAGMTGLSASFLFFNPVKVYMAYAFSHALEYMVFVWAFQRRRYHEPLAHRPPLQRILGHPLLFYGSFTVLVAGAYLLLRFWGRYFWVGEGVPHLFDTPTFRWIFYWGVYQSMVHFYFDGFLWKMRMEKTRAAL